MVTDTLCISHTLHVSFMKGLVSQMGAYCLFTATARNDLIIPHLLMIFSLRSSDSLPVVWLS